MDLLKRIRQKIDEFCFKHMRMDGAQHLIAGILIYDVLKYLIPVWSAILITLIILVAKEVVLDKWIRKGVADWHDIIWGVIGLRLNDTVGNSDVAHRILVNDAVDTELTSINCVKSSADKDNFNDAERKSKTNVVSLHN